MHKIIILSLLVFLISSSPNWCQNINIIPQLKKVEKGEIELVKEELNKLKKKNAGDPNVIFLEAVVTENGEKSNKLYEAVYNNFPNSKFADAALFRSYSYHYALGLYKKADELKNRLSTDYPKSAYLKNMSTDLPSEDDMIMVNKNPYKIRKAGEKKFTVQAGAFSNFQNAQKLKSEFNADGLESKITLKRVNNIRLNIVTVGRFVSKSDANDFVKVLKQNYSLKGRVIPLD